jgi:dTDP-4-dehydrorhamnose reductase
MTKTVLITGSNGLLGQKLTDIYSQLNDYQLVATGRGENRHPLGAAMEYASMDITNAAEVMSVIKKYKPHTVIHTAAMTNVDQCETDPDGCKLLNEDAVQNIVLSCNAVEAHLIALSTDFIFDGKDGPYAEDAKANPVSIYGHSKLKGEEIVIEGSKKWAIARTILVYGLVADMSRSNIVLWAKNALSSKKPVNVVDDQYRMPTLAEDLAIGCRLIEEKGAEGIFNISGKDFMNVYEIVQRVANHFDLSMEMVSKISSESLNQDAKRPPITGFDLTKSKKQLGYNPRSFDEGIAIIEQQLNQSQQK